MALRNIIRLGDEILSKKCREVTEINDRVQQLIDDMLETMYDADGVGLAAPQVGVLRRLFVVDVGDGPMVLINPEIIERSGEQEGSEGCLSVPGKSGTVKRPNYVKIRGTGRDGEPVEYEGEELLARAFCHEYDHLDGVMYTELATEMWDLEDEPDNGDNNNNNRKKRTKRGKKK